MTKPCSKCAPYTDVHYACTNIRSPPPACNLCAALDSLPGIEINSRHWTHNYIICEHSYAKVYMKHHRADRPSYNDISTKTIFFNVTDYFEIGLSIIGRCLNFNYGGDFDKYYTVIFSPSDVHPMNGFKLIGPIYDVEKSDALADYLISYREDKRYREYMINKHASKDFDSIPRTLDFANLLK